MPRVSVGIPVFNGERFIQRAIDCFLGQTYDDLELLIGDNASTDRTLAICRAAAQNDTRVRIFPSERNLGAAPNFNRLVAHARGDYFTWAGHDDWRTPDFLAVGVEALDRNREAVLAYGRAGVEDDKREIFRWLDEQLPELASTNVRFRYHEILWKLRVPGPMAFGLIRMTTLRRTGLIQNTPEPDRVLLNELALHGPFVRLDGPLYVGYGPPGHELHYADSTVRTHRRSWEWLDTRNSKRPKLATYRVTRANLESLLRATQHRHIERVGLAVDLLSSTVMTRTRSKIRRTLTARHRRAVSRPVVDTG